MSEWFVPDEEIAEIEKLLLGKGCHFADDAKAVIRSWKSKDVAACPGSGKTTVLLAKLKILADRMPLEDGAGICVLSHTNVAVNEVRTKLSDCAEKLLRYPNYVGTIQSFIDRFVTRPYVIQTYGKVVLPVEDRIYAEHLYRMICSGKYDTLKYVVELRYKQSANKYADIVDFVSKLYSDDKNALRIEQQGRALAGAKKDSAKQFIKAKEAVLVKDEVIRYKDSYLLAKKAIESLTHDYANLFGSRFRYVFVDEYQDCNMEQREALSKLFDNTQCNVIHIGDSDQAIYNCQIDGITDWIPVNDYLSIVSSCRYSQEIADVLTPLRKEKVRIISSMGYCGHKPLLIVYDMKTIQKVIDIYIDLLDHKNMLDPCGTYKVIGNVGKETVSGIKIGTYWEQYVSTKNKNGDYRYWALVDQICNELQEGKLYRAEQYLRRVIQRILHYVGTTNKDTGKEYTQKSLHERLYGELVKVYSSSVLELSELESVNRESVDNVIRNLFSTFYADTDINIFDYVPKEFMDEPIVTKKAFIETNSIVDNHNRIIQFDTIHGVKGETHDATLYLETEVKGGSDLSRILQYYNVGETVTSSLYEYSRKLAYVGFSRPRKLLCVAMKAETFKKANDTFLKYWDIVDIRTEEDSLS